MSFSCVPFLRTPFSEKDFQCPIQEEQRLWDIRFCRSKAPPTEGGGEMKRPQREQELQTDLGKTERDHQHISLRK